MPPLPPAPPAQIAPAPASTVVHQGPCDASTALALGQGLYGMVDNGSSAPVPVRVYRIGQPGPALGSGTLPAAAVGSLDPAHRELDLEASSRIGPLAYWIGSHGAGEGGQPRPNRRRLFATTLGLAPGTNGKGLVVTAQAVGRPYTTLVTDLVGDPRYAPLELARAAARGAKEPGGLNIEGLAATPSGALLIGFRNPIPEGKALIAPLLNPSGVIAGEAARFGDPVRLDLGGLGIRSLERVQGNLLIVAGPAGGRAGQAGSVPPSALYRWNGQFDSPPERLQVFTAAAGTAPLNPEALLSDGADLVLLSDDGKLAIGGKPCKDLPAERQQFREVRLVPLP